MHWVSNHRALGRASRRHVRRDPGRAGRRARRARVAHDGRRRRWAVHSVDGLRGDHPPLPRRQAARARRAARDRRPRAGRLRDAVRAPCDLFSGARETTAATAALPLYRRLLGEAYEALPAPLQAMHDLKGAMTAEGTATVTRGSGMLARLTAALIGFPHAGENVPVRVDFKVEHGPRALDAQLCGAFVSQHAGARARPLRVAGVRAVRAALCRHGVGARGRQLRLIVRRWSVFGIPLPVALAPRGDSYEYAENGRFHFHVEIAHPFTGLIVGYRGMAGSARVIGRLCAGLR